MSSPLGIGSGDLSAVGSAVREICIALKDSGGASDDYQETIRHLQRLASIFSDFENIKSYSDDHQVNSLVKAIKAQAGELRNFIESFKQKATTKYDATLGLQASSGAHHGTWHKINYAARFSKKDIVQFKRVVAERTDIIELLHSRFIAQLASSTFTCLEAVQKNTTNTSACVVNMQQNEAFYHDDTISRLDALLSNSTTRAQDTTKQLSELLGTVTRQSEQMIVLGTEHNKNVQSVESNIISHLNKRDSTMLQQIALICNDSSVSRQIPIRARRRKAMIKKESAAVRTTVMKTTTVKDQGIIASDQVASFFRSLVQSIHALATFASESLTTNLPAETVMALLLRTAIETFPQLLVYFGVICSGIAALIRTMKAIEWSPTSLFSDDIRFEDVLGRSLRLPWNIFRHWKTFDAMLIDQFRGYPGEDSVNDRQYMIISADSDHFLNEENWERTVSPRAKILMSIIIRGFAYRTEKCPRGCKTTLKELSKSRAACSDCDLTITLGDEETFPQWSDLGLLEQHSDNIPRGRAKVPSDPVQTISAFRRIHAKLPPFNWAPRATHEENSEEGYCKTCVFESMEESRGSLLVICCECGSGPSLYFWPSCLDCGHVHHH